MNVAQETLGFRRGSFSLPLSLLMSAFALLISPAGVRTKLFWLRQLIPAQTCPNRWCLASEKCCDYVDVNVGCVRQLVKLRQVFALHPLISPSSVAFHGEADFEEIRKLNRSAKTNGDRALTNRGDVGSGFGWQATLRKDVLVSGVKCEHPFRGRSRSFSLR